jgi:hypothetical protein
MEAAPVALVFIGFMGAGKTSAAKAAAAALRAGHNQYPPGDGIPSLRAARAFRAEAKAAGFAVSSSTTSFARTRKGRPCR